MTDFSERTLEETPERATRFLGGIGSSPVIFTLLHTLAGMEHADIEEGKELLLAAIGLPALPPAETDTAQARAQRSATAVLDAWDEPNFQRAQATLARHFPSAEAYLFDNLTASQGSKAVKGVATFLVRMDTLEAGSDPARAATKDEDQKAIQLLTRRCFTRQERDRLAALVQTALGSASLITLPDNSALVAQRHASLSALKAWLEEWSAAARAVLTKRSHLITLGLASRRPSHRPEPTPEPAPEPTPAPKQGKK